MEDFRSKSHKDPRIQLDNTQNYHFSSNNYDGVSSNPNGMQDLRCYSASYTTSSAQTNGHHGSGSRRPMEVQERQVNKWGEFQSWNFNDLELQRKKRVVSYKACTVEGKLNDPELRVLLRKALDGLKRVVI